MIVLTDTLTTPEIPLERLLPVVREADATVDAVLRPVPPEWLATPVRLARGRARTRPDIFTFDVRRIVHATNGLEMVTARIDAAFGAMLRDLRERYSVTYEPPTGERTAPEAFDLKLSAESRRLHPHASVELRGLRLQRLSAAP